jgi:hypothetical protein
MSAMLIYFAESSAHANLKKTGEVLSASNATFDGANNENDCEDAKELRPSALCSNQMRLFIDKSFKSVSHN